MSKYLMFDEDNAYFYKNEENPKMVAKWGLGLLEKCDSSYWERSNNPKKEELKEVSINMEKVLDKLLEGKIEFFPLDGTIKYPLIYNECNDEIKKLIDETFHDEAVRKFYNLNEDEEIYE